MRTLIAHDVEEHPDNRTYGENEGAKTIKFIAYYQAEVQNH
jgi:hypothetical protein